MKWPLPASITQRLAILFALVIIVSFTSIGAYLYRSLAMQLALRDDEELIGKVTQIRHLLEETRSPESIGRSPARFLDAVYGHEGLMLLITDESGRTLVQNVPWAALPQADRVVAAADVPRVGDIRVWQTGDASMRLIAARGATNGPSRAEVRVFIARNTSERRALLAAYLRDLSLAGIVGAVLAAALGYATVRHGLKPIDAVAKKANEISSRRLDTRLKLEEAPSELRALTAAFNAMLDRLEDGMKRLAGFAGDLSHDLRTPLHALMMSTQVGLSRPRTAEEYRAVLASNMEHYERLSRLIENTLFLARADNAQLAIRLEPVDLDKALKKIAEYFSGPADDAGVSIVIEASGVVLADAVLLDRAVSNLVSNAIRHSPRDGTVRVTASGGEDATAISVENNGRPIPSDQLGRVFDPYFRGDAARTGAGAGAGLGLAIVSAIMKLHRGTARVVSASATTRFVLTFPGSRTS